MNHYKLMSLNVFTNNYYIYYVIFARELSFPLGLTFSETKFI